MRTILVVLIFASAAFAPVFALNHAPTVSAGADKTTRLGLGFSFADAVANDPDSADALNLAYVWTILSGPAGGAVLGASNALGTSVTFSLIGDYAFRIMVTDPGGLSASDTVNVTVQDSLPSLVLKPQPGETLFVGSTYLLTYQRNTGAPVNINLSTDNGRTFNKLNSGGIRNGTYTWIVGQVTSDSCYVQIRDYVNGGLLAQSGRFAIDDSTSAVKRGCARGRSLSSGAGRNGHHQVMLGAATRSDRLWNPAGRSTAVHGRGAPGVMVK